MAKKKSKAIQNNKRNNSNDSDYVVLDLTNLAVPIAIIIGALIIAAALFFALKDNNSENNDISSETDVQGAANASIDQKLTSVAKEMKLDMGDFEKCMGDVEARQAEINQDQNEIQQIAQAAGEQGAGTPSFLVCKTGDCTKGTVITGALPFEAFAGIIDEYLGEGDGQAVRTEFADYIKDVNLSGVKLSTDDPIQGDKDAPVTIYEFSDYECPFCQRHFLQVEPQIRSAYVESGKARHIFKDLIAVPSHNPAAEKEAMAANCALKQDKYWEFHDYIFNNTQTNGQGI